MSDAPARPNMSRRTARLIGGKPAIDSRLQGVRSRWGPDALLRRQR